MRDIVPAASAQPSNSKANNGRFDHRPSICFVSETSRVELPLLDPSVRYRCYHPAEDLSKQGYRVTVCAAATFFAAPSFDYDLYVFHRPSASRRFFDRVMEQLRALRRTLIADYDDLIFGDEETALSSSAIKNGTMDLATAVRVFADNKKALERFDRFSVSTQPLAERVRSIKPVAQIAVVPNELPDSILCPHLRAKTAFRKRCPKIIGYFAGTRSHNMDFPIVKDVLHRVLSEDIRRTLLVVGPVDLPYGLASMPNVRVRDVAKYWQLPDLMSACDTVIAPLEDTAFNACKSRVKFLEAAIAGCRLIATPIPDFIAVGPSRISFARNQDEWYEALTSPQSESERRASVQSNLEFVSHRSAIAAFKGVGGF